MGLKADQGERPSQRRWSRVIFGPLLVTSGEYLASMGDVSDDSVQV